MVRFIGLTSELNAKDLNTINSNIKAHSGSKIIITTQNKLEATVTSGGNIQYYGNPNAVIKDGDSSGSIKKCNSFSSKWKK